MSDEEFIRYCESHCETPRAGFVPEHIERILRLAGDDRAEAWKNQPVQIISVGPDAMLPVCKKARAALLAAKSKGGQADG